MHSHACFLFNALLLAGMPFVEAVTCCWKQRHNQGDARHCLCGVRRYLWCQECMWPPLGLQRGQPVPNCVVLQSPEN